MASAILRFFRFWYDFIVGDDWTGAAGAVAGLAATAALVRAHVQAWWLMPAVVGALLWVTLHRAVSRQR